MKRTLLTSLAALAVAAMMLAVPVAAGATEAPPAGAAASAPAPSNAPAPSQAPAQSPAAPAPAAKTVRARVLTDCEYGKANDLVELPSDVAKAGKEAGVLDTDKGAVAYAASLEQNKPKPKEG